MTETRAHRRPHLPGGSRLPDAVAQLAEQIEASGYSEVSDIHEFAKSVRTRFQETAAPPVRQRELRTIARHLFTPTRVGMFSEEPTIASYVVSAAMRRPSAPLIRALTQAYFFGYADTGNVLNEIEAVFETIPDTSSPEILRTARALGLLDREEGPKKLAEDLLKSEASPAQRLQQIRLVGGLETSAFTEASFEAACQLLGENEPDEARLNRLLDWSIREGHESSASASGTDVIVQTFPEKIGELAEALLAAWATSEKKPNADLETRIRNFFLAALGDPRFEKNIGWRRVADRHRQTLVRWMNAASVRQFFDIVTDTMRTDDERRMWKYRRKFWTSYLDEVRDAWVVFGPDAERLARRRAHETGDDSFRKFARFSSSGAQSTHAALLLKIGDLTIVEWSHSGKCRIWSSSTGVAPKAYEDDYPVFELRNGEWETSHHGNERYSWQFKVASKIRAHTGISKRQLSYRVD